MNPLVVISIDLREKIENPTAYIAIEMNASNITLSVNPAGMPLRPGQRLLGANAPDEEEVDPETIAVISAAAFHLFRKPVQVRSVKFLSRDKRDSSWAQMGRQNLIESHNYIR